jgi:hypothetical protein
MPGLVPDQSERRKDVMALNELDEYVSSLVSKLPKTTVTPKFGHINFTVGKKVFGFTRPEGVVLKLPQEKAAELVKSKKAILLVMGKKTMKEWVVLRHAKPSDFRKDLDLFKQSLAFVSLKK